MRKLCSTAAALAVAGLLMGCPPSENKTDEPTPAPATDEKPATDATDAEEPAADADADSGESTGIDTSHVKVGQKYVYEASGMEQVYTVKEITDDAIKYEMSVIMNGNPTPPTEASYPLTQQAPAATGDAEAAKAPEPVGTETVTVGGVEFECKIYENAGVKSWVSQKWAPGGVKSMQGDKVLSELKKIEDPS